MIAITYSKQQKTDFWNPMIMLYIVKERCSGLVMFLIEIPSTQCISLIFFAPRHMCRDNENAFVPLGYF